MRVLTVKQPWAWAIIHGGKDVENRTRNIAGGYRGPVAIHAGLSYDVDAAVMPPPTYRPIPVDEDYSHDHPRGAIIGVVDLVGAHEADSSWCSRDSMAGADGSPCSDWAEPDVWHLVLANSRPLVEPIPFRGGLGLRRLDEETVARILEDLS